MSKLGPASAGSEEPVVEVGGGGGVGVGVGGGGGVEVGGGVWGRGRGRGVGGGRGSRGIGRRGVLRMRGRWRSRSAARGEQECVREALHSPEPTTAGLREVARVLNLPMPIPGPARAPYPSSPVSH